MPNATIMDVFLKAVDAYKNRDWNTLKSCYYEHVILKEPDSTMPLIQGPDAVTAFLAYEAMDNPTFTPEPNSNNPIRVHDADDKVGYITHVGIWTDDNHGPRKIHYVFAFVNTGSPEDPDWLFQLLWSNN